jgi:di/tricarboxylate transporter
LFLVEVEREGQILSAVRPRTVLEQGDRLVFAGSPESVLELRNFHGLVLADEQRFKLEGNRSDRRLFEAVLSPSNHMIGKTIKASRFRHRYSAVVLSVSRHGERLTGKLGALRLQAGDTLLIEAQKGFLMRYRNSGDFLLVSKLASTDQTDERKAITAMLIFSAMIIITGFGLLTMFESVTAAAGAMLLTKCINFEDASKSIDYNVLVVIACAFALGAAVSHVGLADVISSYLVGVVSTPFMALVAVYIATVLLTELMTNNAAAIIMLPIALSTAEGFDVQYEPFAIAIMVAASASFMTPTGYQTNLMVMGPGGYRFTDYFKVGAPLSVIVGIMALGLIPVIWPF